MQSLAIRVNGHGHELALDPETPLLWVLRDHLGLQASKFGCGVGVCGICTVLADDQPVRACVTAVGDLVGREILTLEGLSASEPIIRAWIDEQVPQCGYCQSGQILTALALLRSRAHPDRREIDQCMSAVLCRCGTYGRIRRAIVRAMSASEADHADA